MEDRRNSFLARYGAVILEGGIASIPQTLYKYQKELGLNPQQTWFVSAILAYKWDGGLPFPSLRAMSEHTGISRQHLQNIRRDLEGNGWLETVPHFFNNGSQGNNFYDFSPLLAKLEEFIIRDRDKRGGQPQLAGGQTTVGTGANHSWPKEEHTNKNTKGDDLNTIWSSALSDLRTDLNSLVYQTVFADTRLISLSQSQAVVATSNQSALPNLERYTSRVSNCMAKLGYAVSVKFVLAD